MYVVCYSANTRVNQKVLRQLKKSFIYERNKIIFLHKIHLIQNTSASDVSIEEIPS